MTAEEKLLWSKLQNFRFDDPDHQFKFSDRLARENGWSSEYTHRVLEEYRKFLFLCCVAAPATPSDPVDQAWHLHLTFTQSYWQDLCRNTLGKEIHHGPTKGGRKEHVKFNAFYSNTLKAYHQHFGFDAPDDIWHDNETRFANIVFQRVDVTNNWIVPKPKIVTQNMKTINKIKKFIPLSIAMIGFSFIQAVSGWTIFWWVLGFILAIWFLSIIFGNRKNRGGGSGGSIDSGCGGFFFFGCGGDSSCSGGSGCSGCGGGGCGS